MSCQRADCGAVMRSICRGRNMPGGLLHASCAESLRVPRGLLLCFRSRFRFRKNANAILIAARIIHIPIARIVGLNLIGGTEALGT